MKVFNVDALSSEERSIVLNGVTHKVNEMSVEAYLETMKVADELEAASKQELTPAEKREKDTYALIRSITIPVPTLSEAELRKLPFNQLNAISGFVRGELPDELKDASSSLDKVGEEQVEKN